MREVGVILNGVTGRMGMNQHLLRSIVAIREQGGIELDSGARIWPEPVLVGRRRRRLRELAEQSGVDRWTTDLGEVLSDSAFEVYFDALVTSARPAAVEAAIAAGKHVYCEKPIAPDLETALRLARLAREAGVKHGVVQDKLFLPGLLKLADSSRRASSAGSSRSGASSATGCSRAPIRPPSARAGTTVARMAAG